MSKLSIDRNLVMELVRITEVAAISAVKSVRYVKGIHQLDNHLQFAKRHK